MNRGLQDAFSLGWKLALVWLGQAGAGLLHTYEAERRPLAERYDFEVNERAPRLERIGTGLCMWRNVAQALNACS